MAPMNVIKFKGPHRLTKNVHFTAAITKIVPKITRNNLNIINPPNNTNNTTNCFLHTFIIPYLGGFFKLFT